MKKLVFVLVFLLFLPSCSKNILSTEDVSAAAAADFSCRAKIIRGDYITEAKITKNGSVITFFVTAPEELSGLELTKSEGGTRLKIGEAEVPETINLPKNAPFSLFCDMLDTISQTGDFSLSTAGENTSAEGNFFVLVLSTEYSALVSAAFPEYETEFSFSEFAFSGQN